MLDNPKIASRRLDRLQIARLISLLFHPFLVSPLAIVLILYLNTGDLLAAVGWALLCAAFVVTPTLFYLSHKLARRHYTDADVSVREHRHSFYLFGTACMMICFGILVWLEAPRLLLVLFLSGLLTIVAFAITTRLWTKVSIHAGIMAGVMTAVGFYSLPIASILALCALLVTWSRLTLKRHTFTETVWGWVIACTVAYLMMSMV